MYDIIVYDEDVGQFVPAKDEYGKRLSSDTWQGAADIIFTLVQKSPGEYKTEYRTVRKRRKRA